MMLDDVNNESPAPSRWPSPLDIAACASIGAGAIHAAVIGVHGEHRTLALLFVWSAAVQIVWGVALLRSRSAALVATGVAANAVFAGAWFVTRITGIGWIDGLEQREPISFPSTACAGLAVVAVGLGLGVLLTPGAMREQRHSGLGAVAFCVAALTLPAMLIGGTDTHDDGGTDHGHEAESGPLAESNATAVVPPKPYDPSLPIDLSGIDGVTPEQQARAENLVAITLARLPQFADHQSALDRGWHSIGDAPTGFEHLVNWTLINDDDTLNPDAPESLVYRVGAGGTRTLVSAMYMLPASVGLDEVPDIGGRLMQWHIHDDLCFTADEEAPRVAGITAVGGSCPAPLVKLPAAPMIHVWIVPHPCGPFAALEGVGAGQVKEGETAWCDHAHGSTGTFS